MPKTTCTTTYAAYYYSIGINNYNTDGACQGNVCSTIYSYYPCATGYCSNSYYYGVCVGGYDNGMRAAGIAWLVILCSLFLVILPITFCCLWKKGRARPPTYDFTAYTTPNAAPGINS